MENRHKTQIADELVYIAKWFLYGLLYALASCLLFGELKYFLNNFDDVLLQAGPTFVGIGYGYRLVKWVIKWKS